MQTWQAIFSRVPLDVEFTRNGNRYTKTTTRTAHLHKYNRRFYFGQREYVEVSRDIAERIMAEESQP